MCLATLDSTETIQQSILFCVFCFKYSVNNALVTLPWPGFAAVIDVLTGVVVDYVILPREQCAINYSGGKILGILEKSHACMLQVANKFMRNVKVILTLFALDRLTSR